MEGEAEKQSLEKRWEENEERNGWKMVKRWEEER